MSAFGQDIALIIRAIKLKTTSDPDVCDGCTRLTKLLWFLTGMVCGLMLGMILLGTTLSIHDAGLIHLKPR